MYLKGNEMKWREMKGNEQSWNEGNGRYWVLHGNDCKWERMEGNGRNELKSDGDGSKPTVI